MCSFAPSFTFTANGTVSATATSATSSSATTVLDAVVSVVATSGSERVIQSFTTAIGAVSMLLATL